MLEYVKGDIVEITPTYVVVENQGMGYMVNISLQTYSAIQDKSVAKLFLYESIREDAFVLYGFATSTERKMFLLLISVSGVGAGTARMILSSLSSAELCQAIQTENVQAIKSVKGIGLKTAQRILVDLKDKIQELDVASNVVTPVAATANQQIASEAVAALSMLGFASTQSQKAVAKILSDEPALSVEQVIKKALKLL
ncbi:MAG: Holliday junction branch migration protein RuvA [Paludibacteraceae bacterium]|jgi:Holliday junction DNA helicase RuvA|nr:Holliday junction branch migration protein RuvA [Paludibacteraceae bacterium]MEE1174082.1 Holliday junction branch migration protein RuvA [Paludibacteraceae bacterium]